MSSNAAFLRDPAPTGPSRPLYERLPRPMAEVTDDDLSEQWRVATIIRHARQRKGLPQNEAANALGVAPSKLSRWERGGDRLPDHWRPRLAELYGIDPALIGADEAPEAAVTAEERALLASFRRMPPTERAAVLDLVRPVAAQEAARSQADRRAA